MGREKTIALGVLNIKTQPHSPENYLKLFKYLFKMKPLVKIRGADYGTPFSFHPIVRDEPLKGIIGTFFKYLEIDPSKPWLDLEKHEPIVNEEGDPIPQVSKHKRPNTKEIEFVFYPNGHRLFFNAKSITPSMAKKLLESLFCDENIKKKFGLIDVEIETSIEAIEKILKIPKITKLEITFSRPNDDDLAEEEQRFIARMANQKARKIELKLTSDKVVGLIPDDQTKAMMNVAISNGDVTAEGYEGENKVSESTVEHPFEHREKYDTALQTFSAAMINVSSNILGYFTKQKGR